MLTEFERTLMHGRDYDGEDLFGWYAVEKFKGHRVRWTGDELLSRRGHRLPAPEWFLASLPRCALDCELFSSKAGGHDEVASILNKRLVEWHRLSLVPFDFPGGCGDYQARHAGLVTLDLNPPALLIVESNEHADRLLHDVLATCGEGLIVHRPGASYELGRVSSLVKLMPGTIATNDYH